MLIRRGLLAAALLSSLLAVPAAAQKYPDRPITFIVPWAAGGGADLASRLFGAALERELGVPVNIINRTGGNGVTGHYAIASASPDGYTVGMAPGEAKSLADGGRVRILALMADERSPAFPDVPTLKESGINWSFTNWFALVAPKGLPADVRARLVAAGGKAHATAEVQDPLKQRGFNPMWSGPEKAREFALNFATSTRDVLTDLGLAKQ